MVWGIHYMQDIIVADGSKEMDDRLSAVPTNDPGMECLGMLMQGMKVLSKMQKNGK